MMNVKRMARMCLVAGCVMLLSACNITAGTPYPTNNTSGPPPIVYGQGSMEKAGCCDMPCCKDKACCKDMSCCKKGGCCKKMKKGDCKDGYCPLPKGDCCKKPTKKDKHAGHTDHVHDGDEAMMASGTAYDDVMDKMHAAMAAVKPAGDADVDFARGMIPHHQGAIDMAEVLLTKGSDPKLRRLGREIIVAQKREIAFMEYWLETKGQMPESNVTNARPHQHH